MKTIYKLFWVFRIIGSIFIVFLFWLPIYFKVEVQAIYIISVFSAIVLGQISRWLKQLMYIFKSFGKE